MPRFEPFPGTRYDLDKSDLFSVTAPPYDVIDADQRASLAASDPYNVVTIDLPEVGDDPYSAASKTFVHWQTSGILTRDEPSFYVYRMDYEDESGNPQHTTGVFGALELSRPDEGAILPHEQTTPKAKTDRLELLRATRANLSAVWGLSPASGLSALLETDNDPLASWADREGVVHSVWIVDDRDRASTIASTVASAPVVIADGHHRYETSLAYRDERRSSDGDVPGAYDFVLTYVVELAQDQLTVLPIHRLISALPDGFDLVRALDPFFAIAETDNSVDANLASALHERGCLALIEAERTWLLTPRPQAFVGLRDLDTVRLDAALAALPAHELVFQHGIDNVVRAVDKGEAQAGFLVRPATVAQIIDIAHGGERMPPKTTFFYPKPRTGVVFRDLS